MIKTTITMEYVFFDLKNVIVLNFLSDFLKIELVFILYLIKKIFKLVVEITQRNYFIK